MAVYVFPGQGSQKKGMGSELFDEVQEFLAVEKEIDAILGYSLRQLCLEDPDNKINQTQYTQPCLYVVNALHHYKAMSSGGEPPRYFAGHSLGEYNALLAAGAFDFLTGLRLVQKRGALMSQARDGGMAAVIGLSTSSIAKVIQSQDLNTIDVANFNSPGQTIISGPLQDINRAAALFDKAGVKMYVPLPVSAAFHSRYVADAASAFDDYLQDFTFNALHTPVVANVTGRLYPPGDPSAVIRATLVRQITQPVLWSPSIQFLLNRGESEFTEIGPGNVLTRLIQEIKNNVAV
ncbi:MAG: [acyl-carrier-protein] S-malonyltransferase [Rubrivivax sp.]|nr:MAG: [acyl-carrier-protein] S-malonyltransferase [Rubrivivax sp.]